MSRIVISAAWRAQTACLAADAGLGKMQSIGDGDVRPHARNKKDYTDTGTKEVQHHW